MPTFLALAWSAFASERHPRVKLHALVDVAEIAVRFTTAVALAEVAHANGGRVPEPIAIQLRDRVERPTLGQWLGILRVLSDARPAPLLAPRVFDLSTLVFEPAFPNEGAGGRIETSLLVLRNHLAHGGGMSTRRSADLLDAHAPRVEALVMAVVEALRGLRVIAVERGAAVALAGSNPTPLPTNPGLTDGPHIVGDAGALSLLPLAVFGPVQIVGANGVLERRGESPAAQVYARAHEGRLDYVPLGRDEPISEDLGVEHFRNVFRLDTPRAKGKPLDRNPFGFE